MKKEPLYEVDIASPEFAKGLWVILTLGNLRFMMSSNYRTYIESNRFIDSSYDDNGNPTGLWTLLNADGVEAETIFI